MDKAKIYRAIRLSFPIVHESCSIVRESYRWLTLRLFYSYNLLLQLNYSGHYM